MLPILLLSLLALGRSRRVLVVALLLLAPAGLSIAFVASETHGDGQRFAIELFDGLVLPVLIPLTALIFATSALGSEVEDRTLIYLLFRPVSRLAVALAKWLAATLITVVLVEAALVLMVAIAARGGSPIAYPGGTGNTLAAVLTAGCMGALAYCGAFLLLGLLAPRRGLLVGFLYVLAWEGLAAGLSSALATLSVRRYVLGVLDARLGDSPLAAIQPSSLGGGTAAVVLVAVAVGSIALTTLQLRRMELP